MIKSHSMWESLLLNIQVALLHARHNADPFSKFTFLAGKYKVGCMLHNTKNIFQEYNMTQLNITNTKIHTYTNYIFQEYNMTQLNIRNVRDYSMFMALSSHKQVPWLQNAWELAHTMQCYNKMQPYQGVGQSVAWANYQEEAAGRPLSQLCLDGPKRTWMGPWKRTWNGSSEPGWAQANDLRDWLPQNLNFDLLTHSRL